MLEQLKIGVIVKPQGIKGEIKVQPLTDDINRFKWLKKVLIDNVEHRVISAKIGGGFIILSLFGVGDRNTAELLRGKFLLVERDNAVELEEGRYFIADIVGCKVVFEDNTTLGQVVEITTAKTDIFTVKTVSNKIVRFPFLKDLLVQVDIENNLVIIKKTRYLEVCCYED